MNTLIIYDSQYGNTERIAYSIANALNPLGHARIVRADVAQFTEVQGMNVLIVGCPTQGWNATSAIRSLLRTARAEQLRGVGVACFDTRFRKPRWLTGSAANVMRRTFAKLDATLLAPPESFFVEGSEGPLGSGELERAAAWAQTLASTVEAEHPAVP